MITAPSWSAVRGEKIVRSRSAETSPWIMTPVSATSSSPVSRSMTMSAPWPSAERPAAARGDLGGDVTRRAPLRRREEPGERADAADALERPAQLGLEDDDEGEQADDRAGLEDAGQEDEIEGDREGVDDDEDADADHQADGPCPADEAEQPVDQERRDPDVDHRGQADLAEDRSEEIRHRRPSVASPPSATRSGQPQIGGETRVVGEPLRGHRAQAGARHLVARQLGEPAQEHELVGGRCPPATVEVQLRQREVDAPSAGASASAW